MHFLTSIGWISSLGLRVIGSAPCAAPGEAPGARPRFAWAAPCPDRAGAPARPPLWESLQRGAGMRRLVPSLHAPTDTDLDDEEDGDNDDAGGDSGGANTEGNGDDDIGDRDAIGEDASARQRAGSKQ